MTPSISPGTRHPATACWRATVGGPRPGSIPGARHGGEMNRRLTSKRLRAALWIAANGKCQLCGIELPDNWHADHVIPWSKSGTTNVHDMQALCPKCNLIKGAK